MSDDVRRRRRRRATESSGDSRINRVLATLNVLTWPWSIARYIAYCVGGAARAIPTDAMISGKITS